ncbi:MAG: aldo/keto reductase [Bacteroidaceae bacterium]|nr:aldo/keto reductase [Bacteroidaceae bacterium]
MMSKDKHDLSRREFLKRLGLTSAVAMVELSPLSAITKKPVEPVEPTGNNMMTYRVNRNTGDKISLLGYGMMRLPFKERQIDQELVNEEVKYALEHGVNYFDTSPHYVGGRSESSLGTALKASGFPRKSFFVATKMSNFGEPEWPLEKSIEMYHKSFEYLQVDYIDYYLLHGIGMGSGMETFQKRFIDNGLLDFLLKEREEGRIRNLGFSYHADIAVFDYLLANHDKYHWNFAQIEMNYVDWRHAKEVNTRNTNAEYLYAECEKRGIQCVMMEPLLGGRLAKLPDVYTQQLKERRPDDSIASWAFRFCGTYPNVLTALSGMTYMEHLVDNVKTYSPLDPCTTDELALLEDIAKNVAAYPTIPCTDCKYCMPCPYGVNIPGNFAYYNSCVNNGTLPPTEETAPDFKEKQAAFVAGFNKTLKLSELASACTGCRQCLSKCPQRIRIPNQLSRLVDLIEKGNPEAEI